VRLSKAVEAATAAAKPLAVRAERVFRRTTFFTITSMKRTASVSRDNRSRLSNRQLAQSWSFLVTNIPNWARTSQRSTKKAIGAPDRTAFPTQNVLESGARRPL